MDIEIKEQIGNKEIINYRKTAFLCSRNIPSGAILKCYDWAIQQREKGTCVISGFHSKIEKDVLHYLLKGKQAIIVALARGMKKRVESEFKKPLEEGRLLIISPFEKNTKRITKESSIIRNQMMIEMADEVVIGYLQPNGQLENLSNYFNIKIRSILM
ncbi:MAG: DNA-binding protein [bacterium]